MGESQDFDTQLEHASQRLVTQSPYFSPEFNTAIIDGPLRIYFCDHHETEALHIYFRLQEILVEDGIQLSHIPRHTNNVYIMLYPNPTAFPNAMKPKSGEHPTWLTKRFEDHEIIGIDIQKMQIDDTSFRDELCHKVKLQFCQGNA